MSELLTDFTFRARALAQAHPLTESAAAFREAAIVVERDTQPMPEFADWAATAFLVGYCVRRVEESDASDVSTVVFGPFLEDPDLLMSSASRIAEDLRAGRPAGIDLLPADLIEAALDTIIATEVDKRNEYWRAHVSNDDWSVFEEYVAWWVVHGYALRAAERRAVITP